MLAQTLLSGSPPPRTRVLFKVGEREIGNSNGKNERHRRARKEAGEAWRLRDQAPVRAQKTPQKRHGRRLKVLHAGSHSVRNTQGLLLGRSGHFGHADTDEHTHATPCGRAP